jgi:hypothetical protein
MRALPISFLMTTLLTTAVLSMDGEFLSKEGFHETLQHALQDDFGLPLSHVKLSYNITENEDNILKDI